MLLFDTHALVWLASNLKNLSARARHAIQQHSDELYVSSISALEIAILAKRNRLSLPVAVEEFVDRALRQHGIHEVPLDRQIAIASTRLPDIHNDPFDRIIIATAQLNGMSILSRDQIIPQYPEVKVVW
jgi:PIN domain nuclease of toxin-antitoxin system